MQFILALRHSRLLEHHTITLGIFILGFFLHCFLHTGSIALIALLLCGTFANVTLSELDGAALEAASILI